MTYFLKIMTNMTRLYIIHCELPHAWVAHHSRPQAEFLQLYAKKFSASRKTARKNVLAALIFA